MLSARRSAVKRAFAWLFAALCLTAVATASPRAPAFNPSFHASAGSIAPVPARDAGKALVRDTHAVRLVAPTPEPLPPVVPPHVAARVERPVFEGFADLRLVPLGISVRVVRWLNHVPRMDSGEPPRREAFAS